MVFLILSTEKAAWKRIFTALFDYLELLFITDIVPKLSMHESS